MIIGLIFIVFLALLMLGIPIVISIGVTTIFPLLTNIATPYRVDTIVRWAVQGADSITVIAIPMFILAGAIMSKGGVSKKLFDVFAYFVGKRTAGLPMATIMTCLFYGAISGSGVATAAAVGSMTIPILTRLGYDKIFVAALVATAGSLGVIIPPSIPFVMFGSLTNTSVGDLFVAGIIPGILIGISLMVYAYYYCKKNGEDKEKINKMVDDLHSKGFFRVFKESFWAVLSPVIILGGIYSGVVTPTEAATASVFYSLFICLFVYKTLKLSDIPNLLKTGVSQYAGLVMLLALANSFSKMLTVMQGAQIVSDFVITYLKTGVVLLIGINILMFIMGMFMDTGPAVAILGPILVPVAASLGINPVHLGIVMVSNLAIGMVTPPFGMNLFVVSPLIDKSSSIVGFKAIPFIIAFIIALILITYIPSLSLFLVNAMK